MRIGTSDWASAAKTLVIIPDHRIGFLNWQCGSMYQWNSKFTWSSFYFGKSMTRKLCWKSDSPLKEHIWFIHSTLQQVIPVSFITEQGKQLALRTQDIYAFTNAISFKWPLTWTEYRIVTMFFIWISTISQPRSIAHFRGWARLVLENIGSHWRLEDWKKGFHYWEKAKLLLLLHESMSYLMNHQEISEYFMVNNWRIIQGFAHVPSFSVKQCVEKTQKEFENGGTSETLSFSSREVLTSRMSLQ